MWLGDGTVETLEKIKKRLTALEKEVAEWKRKKSKNSEGWIESLSGNMKQFPEWEEVRRTGKEIGNAQDNPEE